MEQYNNWSIQWHEIDKSSEGINKDESERRGSIREGASKRCKTRALGKIRQKRQSCSLGGLTTEAKI